MQVSMYKASVPRFVYSLNNIAAMPDKAQAQAEAKRSTPRR